MINKTNKENKKRKVLKRIKWENITFIIMLLLGLVSIRHHIILNGIYKELILEIITYIMFAFGFRYIVKDIRKNPTNWTF